MSEGLAQGPYTEPVAEKEEEEDEKEEKEEEEDQFHALHSPFYKA